MSRMVCIRFMAETKLVPRRICERRRNHLRRTRIDGHIPAIYFECSWNRARMHRAGRISTWWEE